MLRTTITLARSLRVAARTSSITPALRASTGLGQIRFQTNVLSKPEKTPEQLVKKAALERQDDLQRDWDATEITYADLKPRTDSPTPDSYLIDVREPDEVIQGMIPSAINLPLSVLSNSLHLSAAEFREKHGFEKPGFNQQITFYCRSGKRSTSACDVAKRNGYTDLLNYKGSWLEWVEKESKKA